MPAIEELKEKYQGEGLAIHIIKEGPFGPEEGEILYHSKDEGEVWKRIRGDRRRIYVAYAGPLLEEGQPFSLCQLIKKLK